MANLNEINVPPDADAAAAWAIREEYELRRESYDIARMGFVGAMQRIYEVIVGLDEVEQRHSRRDQHGQGSQTAAAHD